MIFARRIQHHVRKFAIILQENKSRTRLHKAGSRKDTKAAQSELAAFPYLQYLLPSYRRLQRGKAAEMAPKPYTKTACPSVPAFTAKTGGRQKETAMPRMSKKRKREWAFFLNDCSRITYNPLCRKCRRSCKQSFRTVVVDFPLYYSKRVKDRPKGGTPNE